MSPSLKDTHFVTLCSNSWCNSDFLKITVIIYVLLQLILGLHPRPYIGFDVRVVG